MPTDPNTRGSLNNTLPDVEMHLFVPLVACQTNATCTTLAVASAENGQNSQLLSPAISSTLAFASAPVLGSVSLGTQFRELVYPSRDGAPETVFLSSNFRGLICFLGACLSTGVVT